MSAITLFYVAIVVFMLMITGLYLSVREFIKASREPSMVKETVRSNVIRRDLWQDRKYGT